MIVGMIAPPPDPPPIIGRASVIDGDTIEIHGQRIRLWGVDAPESGQTCDRNGENYRCGQEAAAALDEMLSDRSVSCTPQGRPDRYRRIVARCRIQVLAPSRAATFQDVGGAMVAAGHAVDYPQYSRSYYALWQFGAQDADAGLWAGEFEMPWEWRARQR